jgi:TPR repeat protein
MFNRLLVVPFVLFVAFASGGAAADSFDEAMRASRAGDYTRAYSLLRPLAEKGDPRAQHQLGKMYEDGIVPTKEHRNSKQKKARMWYERSAAQNYGPGKRALGDFLVFNGIDAMRGYRMLLELAEAGDARAQAILGYRIAEGAKRDYPQRYRIPGTAADGLAWLQKAVDQKDKFAGFLLWLYHSHHGSDADTYYWKLISDGMFQHRSPLSTPPVTDRLTKTQRIDIERRAAAWLTARGVKPMHAVGKH